MPHKLFPPGSKNKNSRIYKEENTNLKNSNEELLHSTNKEKNLIKEKRKIYF
jgi:hypothetical protein